MDPASSKSLTFFPWTSSRLCALCVTMLDRSLLSLLLLSSLFTGCMPWIGIQKERGGTIGTSSHGLLVNGVHMPRRGKSFRFYHGGDRRWGTPEMIGMLKRIAGCVAEEHPGSILEIGDISSKTGGFIGGHRSHRTGRDVDLAFFSTDAKRRVVSASPLVRFDRFGVGVREKHSIAFDTKRNWKLVEAMLGDTQASVQWIFVSDGLKAKLLQWALDNDRDIELIERAASVLHQPGDSAPHDDHFHVRIYCPDDDFGAACQDMRPFWPWLTHPKREDKFNSDQLAKLALEGL